MILMTLIFFIHTVCPSQDSNDLDPLIELIGESSDAQLHLDVLKGILEALKGQRDVEEPKAWPKITKLLRESPLAEVRELSHLLSLKFGSQIALVDLRDLLVNKSVSSVKRIRALNSLLEAKDVQLPVLLIDLIDDLALQQQAIIALAAFDKPEISKAIYSTLNGQPHFYKISSFLKNTIKPSSLTINLVAFKNNRKVEIIILNDASTNRMKISKLGIPNIKSIKVKHGKVDSICYIIDKKLAYISDVSQIFQKDFKYLKNLNYLVLDCLWINHHPSHLNLEESLDLIFKLNPKKAILTNLSPVLDYDYLKKILPKKVIPAFDGLTINL